MKPLKACSRRSRSTPSLSFQTCSNVDAPTFYSIVHTPTFVSLSTRRHLLRRVASARATPARSIRTLPSTEAPFVVQQHSNATPAMKSAPNAPSFFSDLPTAAVRAFSFDLGNRQPIHANLSSRPEQSEAVSSRSSANVSDCAVEGSLFDLSRKPDRFCGIALRNKPARANYRAIKFGCKIKYSTWLGNNPKYTVPIAVIASTTFTATGKRTTGAAIASALPSFMYITTITRK